MSKALKKGDKHFSKGEFDKAYIHYRQAHSAKPTPETLDKLITSHKQKEAKWTEEDFLENLTLTMQKQEMENPSIKRVHARFDEDFKKVTELIKKILIQNDEEAEITLNEIVAYGEKALYPLLDFIVAIKKKTKPE
ncbi:MAG TPA: hypothetical protein DDW49_04955 [Deltaproteobacteria bacterium]|nr:MAG: hypothetical protein A2048_09865 [Deltaproteobacteria bacterium GWA2_45_12]HBF12725.1 hypothetical protein [Deltaproteobacteria bacterium]